jgi:ATP-dependent exoDNAse (exonuclease V) alpha subunit
MKSLKEILEEKRLLAQRAKEEVEEQMRIEIEASTQCNEEGFIGEEKEEQNLSEGKKETFSLSITLNKEQLLAKELAFAGKSFCLTGAAGTGKTTAQREIARSLLLQNKLGTHDFRIQGSGSQRWTGPSVAFVAYTRIASGNLRRAIHKDPELENIFLHNITTIHNLLEYSPETYYDYEEQKEKFRFVPRRTASNPLDITHLIIEESSMVDATDLWGKLYAALRPDTQIIFLGDINQLQPVFGASILNYALIQLPVVELTHVYRQAGDSTILENAHNILNGRKLVEAEDFKIVRGGDKQFSQAKLSVALATTFQKWEELGEYDPEQDIILKVFYNKRVGVVKTINRNMNYQGKMPHAPSTKLTRFGSYVHNGKDGDNNENEDDDFLLAYEGIDLEKMIQENEKEDLVRQASHVVTLDMEDEEEVTLSAVGDYSPSTFSLGYCLTVHKAQGCEWRNVYIILHKDHSIMAYRELLYTAVTRASQRVILIAKDYMIDKAIATQRIKGNTLADKIEFFNAKIALDQEVRCYK